MSQDQQPNAPAPAAPPAAIPPWTVTAPQKDPPIFAGLRGEDVEDWLEQYDRVSAINHWNDPSKLNHVAFYLTDVAKTWFYNHEIDFTNWNSFTRQLRQIFANPSVRSDIAKKKLAERVQHPGESYTSYIEDVLALCRRVNSTMAENDRVRHLLKGIGPVAFNALIVQNPTTVADIINTCQRLDEIQTIRLQPGMCEHTTANDNELRALIRSIIREELHAQGSQCHTDVCTSSPGDALRNIVREELATMPRVQVQVPSPAPTPAPTYAQIAAVVPPSQQQFQQAPAVQASLSPLPPRATPYNSWRPPRPVCFYCGIRGHISRFCRRRQQDERRGYADFERDEFSASGPPYQRSYPTYRSYPGRSPSPQNFGTASTSRFSRRRSPSPIRRSSSPLRPAASSPGHGSEN